MKIKAKITEKQVRTPYPTREMRMRGENTVKRQRMNVSVTDLDHYERVLVLNLGEIGTLSDALKLLASAVEITGQPTYKVHGSHNLLEKLSALRVKQNGLDEEQA